MAKLEDDKHPGAAFVNGRIFTWFILIITVVIYFNIGESGANKEKYIKTTDGRYLTESQADRANIIYGNLRTHGPAIDPVRVNFYMGAIFNLVAVLVYLLSGNKLRMSWKEKIGYSSRKEITSYVTKYDHVYPAFFIWFYPFYASVQIISIIICLNM